MVLQITRNCWFVKWHALGIHHTRAEHGTGSNCLLFRGNNLSCYGSSDGVAVHHKQIRWSLTRPGEINLFGLTSGDPRPR
jgi:hypothetical protein